MMTRRDKYLRKKYGITERQYKKKLKEQGGKCAICCRSPKLRSLAVDHNHITGGVRGLLCYLCNYGLGYYKDNPVALKNLMEYINKYECSKAE